MKILVLGAGGVGGYFGGRLAEAGADVTFLVRPARREQLVREGLRVTSALGDVSVPVNTVVASESIAGYDLVLFTCKAYDLASAVDAIEPAMQGSCAVLPLLNGLAHLEVLDDRFGRDQVMGGTCHIDVVLQKDGVIRHAGTLQRLTFGERDGSSSDRATRFGRALAPSKVEWEMTPHIEQALWEKLIFLSVLAAATCLFRGNIKEIMTAPGGREAVERMLETTIEIARREGYPPSQGAIDFARNRLTDATGAWSASMSRDVEAGRPTEADHIIGWMLERARRHGVDASLLSLAYTHLKTYDARRTAARLPTTA